MMTDAGKKVTARLVKVNVMDRAARCQENPRGPSWQNITSVQPPRPHSEFRNTAQYQKFINTLALAIPRVSVHHTNPRRRAPLWHSQIAHGKTVRAHCPLSALLPKRKRDNHTKQRFNEAIVLEDWLLDREDEQARSGDGGWRGEIRLHQSRTNGG